MLFRPVLSSDMGVNLIGGGLVVLGLVLLVVTLVFWRSAVEDPDVLAPLEVMADRRFARADEHARVDMLDRHRPTGAGAVHHETAEPVLVREPVSEPERPYVDPYDHADDAVDIVDSAGMIDPLLQTRREER